MARHKTRAKKMTGSTLGGAVIGAGTGAFMGSSMGLAAGGTRHRRHRTFGHCGGDNWRGHRPGSQRTSDRARRSGRYVQRLQSLTGINRQEQPDPRPFAPSIPVHRRVFRKLWGNSVFFCNDTMSRACWRPHAWRDSWGYAPLLTPLSGSLTRPHPQR